MIALYILGIGLALIVLVRIILPPVEVKTEAAPSPEKDAAPDKEEGSTKTADQSPNRIPAYILDDGQEAMISAEQFVMTDDAGGSAKWLCGHEGPERISIEVMGINYGQVRARDNRLPCFDCLHRHAIRCVTCGGPILPGESVGTYIASADDKVPSWAKYAKHDPRCVIHCMAASCPETGAGYCGEWNGSGIDYAFRIIEESGK